MEPDGLADLAVLSQGGRIAYDSGTVDGERDDRRRQARFNLPDVVSRMLLRIVP